MTRYPLRTHTTTGTSRSFPSIATTPPLTSSSGSFLETVSSATEIDDDDVNGLVAKPRHLTHIVACGARGSTAGTSGGYDIYDQDKKVCHVSWSNPLNRGIGNSLDIVDLDGDYNVECKGASLEAGPIGHVSIRVKNGGSP